MRGDLRAASVRSFPRVPRLDWSTRIASLRHRRQRSRQKRLEVIERLDRIERSSRRTGEHFPDVATTRRWC